MVIKVHLHFVRFTFHSKHRSYCAWPNLDTYTVNLAMFDMCPYAS